MSSNIFSNEIESSIISGIIKDGNKFSLIVDICNSDDFYWKPYRWIYDSFYSLYDRTLSIDYLTVSEDLSRSGKLDDFCVPNSDLKGSEALKKLLEKEVNLENIESYALQCHDDCSKRKVNELADNAKQWILDGNSGVNILTKMEAELSKISTFAGVSSRAISTSDVTLSKAISETEYANKGNRKYIETGLKSLDNLIGGFFPEQLITIAGRQGHGKSALAMTMALNVSILNKWKKKIGIFSLEMSSVEYMQRMISALSGISSLRLKMGNIYENEWDKYEKALSTIRESNNMIFDDSSQLTIHLVRNKLRKMCDLGAELVFVDQLGLLSGGASKNDQEYARIDRLSYQFKNLAREFQIPLVIVQQMSRSIESVQRSKDREPKASDLSQSGESAPNIIMMLDHKMEQKIIKSTKIWIVKNRDGAMGAVDVKFEPERTYFRDLTEEERNAISPTMEFMQEDFMNG